VEARLMEDRLPEAALFRRGFTILAVFSLVMPILYFIGTSLLRQQSIAAAIVLRIFSVLLAGLWVFLYSILLRKEGVPILAAAALPGSMWALFQVGYTEYYGDFFTNPLSGTWLLWAFIIFAGLLCIGVPVRIHSNRLKGWRLGAGLLIAWNLQWSLAGIYMLATIPRQLSLPTHSGFNLF
jgi:hypothetical protein